MTVSGSMQATIQSEVNGNTGNPLGMNTDLTFKGSTDTDFGTATWTMATDGTFVGESGADHSLKLATSMGTVGIGNSGDAANAVDDITPSAFEEANGSGSGSYSADFGSGMDGSMSFNYALSDIMGTGVSIAYNYYPRLDGVTNNEKAASYAAGSETKDKAQSVNVGIPLAGLPVLGDSPLGGMKITLGYEESDSRVTDAQGKQGGTVAVNLPVGPLSIGYQKKAYQALGTTVSEANKAFYKDDILGIAYAYQEAQTAILIANRVFYKDDIYGLAYAVNDDLAISYNVIESAKHSKDGINDEQETKAINAAYTVGGLTIGFQDAKTSNSGYVADTDNDTRTISIKTAF